MLFAGLEERPELPAAHVQPDLKVQRGGSMRAYQLPKGGAGIDALVKVERPIPSRPIGRSW